MSGDSPEAFRAHLKTYWAVFVALLVLTGVTVWVAGFDVSLPVAVLIAMIVASIKGTLVGGYFMHLFEEKKAILYTLALTIVLFAVLMIVPILTILDNSGI